MKITIDIPDLKCGKFCSRKCMFIHWSVVSDWCSLYGNLKRVRKSDSTRMYFISYQHEKCKEAQV